MIYLGGIREKTIRVAEFQEITHGEDHECEISRINDRLARRYRRNLISSISNILRPHTPLCVLRIPRVIFFFSGWVKGRCYRGHCRINAVTLPSVCAGT